MGQALESLWNRRQAGLAGVRSVEAVRARSRRLPSVIVVMAAVMLIVGCLSCYNQTRLELKAATAERQAEALRVDDLKIQTQRVAAQIERLKSDPRAVEALARQNLGFVRRGEILLRIRPDEHGLGDTMAGAGPSRAGGSGTAKANSNPQSLSPVARHAGGPATPRRDPSVADPAAVLPHRTAAETVPKHVSG